MKFEFHNPTRLIFGAGVLSHLGQATRSYGKHALLVTGGGSVKRSGVFDRAVASLTAAGVSYAECTGVEPNPRNASVIRGADIARKEKCDVVIALGGGSVMDAAKVMAAAVFYDGDPWDMILHGQPTPHVPTEALPIVTVPTLAATGSEMNCGAVITNEATTRKSHVKADALFPKVAVVDPELTLSVPKDQTAYGVCDLITHVMEGYFNGQDGTPLQDRFAESVIQTAIEWGPKAVANGNDLEAREQVQWASVVALNGWVQAGVLSGFPAHMIEHVISGHHDIAHGAGLAILVPALMRFSVSARPERYVQFAQRIFGIPAKNPTDMDCAMAGIDQYEAFLRDIGCPTRLSEVGIGDKLLRRYAQDTLVVANDGKDRLPARPRMTEDDIVTILRSAL